MDKHIIRDDRSNQRIMGFDNAHAIECGGKRNVSKQRIYDHWHKTSKDPGHPYIYKNAGELIEDFWVEVDKILKEVKK